MQNKKSTIRDMCHCCEKFCLQEGLNKIQYGVVSKRMTGEMIHNGSRSRMWPKLLQCIDINKLKTLFKITRKMRKEIKCNIAIYVGRDSPVGIATRYGLDGPGIKCRWGEIFRTCPDRPWGPPSLLYNGYRAFPGGKAAGAWRWPSNSIYRRG
jgi:hypothetical protein